MVIIYLYYQISTEKSVHPPRPQALQIFETIPPVAAEIEEAIKRMKSPEATGPDIASELWKAKNWDPILWFNEFFNRAIEEGKTPSDWQESTTVPK